MNYLGKTIAGLIKGDHLYPFQKFLKIKSKDKMLQNVKIIRRRASCARHSFVSPLICEKIYFTKQKILQVD